MSASGKHCHCASTRPCREATTDVGRLRRPPRVDRRDAQKVDRCRPRTARTTLFASPAIDRIPSTRRQWPGRSLEPCNRVGPDQRPCLVLVCPAWLNADTHRKCRATIAQRSALRAIAFPLRVAGPTKLGRTAPSPATSPALLAANACVAETHSRRTPVTGITVGLDGDDQHTAAFLMALFRLDVVRRW
jgi:hypothetical protein